jgi:C-terminal processing protease CtpA/Prc
VVCSPTNSRLSSLLRDPLCLARVAFACPAFSGHLVADASERFVALQGEKARVGIGAYFQRDKDIDSVLSVKSLLKGSPAQQCNKIAVGDHIMAVNGASVESFSLAELAEKLLGPTGSVVECTFARRGTNERYAVSLTRGINSDKWSVASRNK